MSAPLLSSVPSLALFYDDTAFTETLQRSARPDVGKPMGLMGREVAGKEFLDVFLHHGRWDDLVAVVRDPAQVEGLVRRCREALGGRPERRRLRVVRLDEFHARFFPTAPAGVFHLPTPLDERFAWARQHGNPTAYALCGVTHTLCSVAAVRQLGALVTAPFEPFDVLVCTSRAVVGMVRAVTDAYADYLRERHGGTPGLRVRLETIPLGVDTERFRPPTAEERLAQRRKFGVADDETAVLFVGRLSHHAKAHPFPLFQGLAGAARQTGQKVHLLLAGWAAHPSVEEAFREGAARRFAPGVRVQIVDGTRPEVRRTVWHAADLFASFSDNIQETFGLSVLEAMAVGLPVVASDWDGYRDIVDPGVTGLLVPTAMVRGATESATSRLWLGELSYDHFLAECSQSAVVDVDAAVTAFRRLLSDEPLRRSLGEAGRRRAVERFSWVRVLRQYEELWRRQDQERRAATLPRRTHAGPACYPSAERSFACYPTHWLDDADLLEATPGAAARLPVLLSLPLTHHAAGARVTDPGPLRDVLSSAVAPTPLLGLAQLLESSGADAVAARATLAWMLKYGLLRAGPHLPESYP